MLAGPAVPRAGGTDRGPVRARALETPPRCHLPKCAAAIPHFAGTAPLWARAAGRGSRPSAGHSGGSARGTHQWHC